MKISKRTKNLCQVFLQVSASNNEGKHANLSRNKVLIIWEWFGPVDGLARLLRWNLGPDYMGTAWFACPNGI